jgi:hypothetical protein
MSVMEVYRVDSNGDCVPLVKLRNSWLGASFVWTQVGNRYLGEYDFEKEYALYVAGGRQGKFDHTGWVRAWALQHDPRVAEWDWATLVSTFDWCVLPAEHLGYLSRQYRLFHEAHLAHGTSHYRSLAAVFSELLPEGTRGVCFNATSVNENPWWVRDLDPDQEGRPYNIDLDTKHWLFDPLKRPVTNT